MKFEKKTKELVVMSKKTEEFLRKMLDFFPSAEVEYRESIAYYGEALDTYASGKDSMMATVFSTNRLNS
ncbi:hypothetical protein SAMN05428962_2516 [Paenibacillus sp. BC26]|nr:hypothetical protein SAMN05428962_2516 [Paenibacillus sp. BC26]